MDGQVKQLQDQQDHLVDAQQQLQTKIESFRSQKEILKAQYSAAEAQVKVGEAATGIGKGMADTGLAIQRAKDKTEEMQARAGAIDELTSAGALEDFTAGDQDQLTKELSQISTSEPGRRRAREAQGRGRHRRRSEGDRRPRPRPLRPTSPADDAPAAS